MRAPDHRPRPHTLTLILLAALGFGACGSPTASGHTTRPAPVASDTILAYTTFSSAAGGVTGIGGRDGAMRWHAEAGHANWTPLIVGGVLYAYTTDFKGPTWAVVAVRLRDGMLLWRTPVPFDGSNPEIASDGVSVAVNASQDGLYVLDASNGAVRWHEPIPTTGRPIVRDGVIFALLAGDKATGQNASTGLAAFSAGDGKERWHSSNGLASSRFEVHGAALYGNYGPRLAVALSALDGHELWENTSAGFVIAATDRLVLVNSDHLAALDPRDGHELWHASADFGLYSVNYNVLAVTDTTIYGSHMSDIIAVRASDGSQAWTVHFDQHSVEGVIADGGVVFAYHAPLPHELAPCPGDCVAHIVALDGATGAHYWSRDVPDGQLLAEPVG